MLLKREVLKKVGLALTRTPLGAFDLEALSRRVTQAGYQLACCKDVYIHHFGSRSPAMKEPTSPTSLIESSS